MRPQSSAGKRLPPPPPRLGGMGFGGNKPAGGPAAGAAGKMMPPPPPLPNRSAGGGDVAGQQSSSSSFGGGVDDFGNDGGGSPSATNVPPGVAVWRSPPEILSLFIDFIPTYYVPANCVAAILSDDARALVRGRGKFNMFLKRYRFFFDARLVDGTRVDIRLRDDVNHPKRGAADEKFAMTDVGDVTTYTAKPEFITSLDSLEGFGNQSVALRPHTPPPSVHVRLEERVPVLERLKTLIPKSFVSVEELEERIPEDILFHPYFDCQGGLLSIATKFPEFFQVVDGRIRLRPPHLAPMATGELSFDDSPMPELIARVRKLVCLTDVPQWVSVTALYEQLSTFEKRTIKRDFKSFAGFLRSHGRSLAISADTLSVALWIPPHMQGRPAESAASSSSPQLMQPPPQRTAVFTPSQILNELFDKFPPHRTLSIAEASELLPPAARAAAPRDLGQFLAAHPNYFIVEYPEDAAKTQIRRTSDREPLDIADAIYPYIYGAAAEASSSTSEEGLASSSNGDAAAGKKTSAAARVGDVLPRLPSGLQRHIRQVGVATVVGTLPHWLELRKGGGSDGGGGNTIVDDALVPLTAEEMRNFVATHSHSATSSSSAATSETSLAIDDCYLVARRSEAELEAAIRSSCAARRGRVAAAAHRSEGSPIATSAASSSSPAKAASGGGPRGADAAAASADGADDDDDNEFTFDEEDDDGDAEGDSARSAAYTEGSVGREGEGAVPPPPQQQQAQQQQQRGPPPGHPQYEAYQQHLRQQQQRPPQQAGGKGMPPPPQMQGAPGPAQQQRGPPPGHPQYEAYQQHLRQQQQQQQQQQRPPQQAGGKGMPPPPQMQQQRGPPPGHPQYEQYQQYLKQQQQQQQQRGPPPGHPQYEAYQQHLRQQQQQRPPQQVGGKGMPPQAQGAPGPAQQQQRGPPPGHPQYEAYQQYLRQQQQQQQSRPSSPTSP